MVAVVLQGRPTPGPAPAVVTEVVTGTGDILWGEELSAAQRCVLYACSMLLAAKMCTQNSTHGALAVSAAVTT